MRSPERSPTALDTEVAGAHAPLRGRPFLAAPRPAPARAADEADSATPSRHSFAVFDGAGADLRPSPPPLQAYRRDRGPARRAATTTPLRAGGRAPLQRAEPARQPLQLSAEPIQPVSGRKVGKGVVHVLDALLPVYTAFDAMRQAFKGDPERQSLYAEGRLGTAFKVLNKAKLVSQSLASAASVAAIITGILAIFTLGASATVAVPLAITAAALHGLTLILRLIDIGAIQYQLGRVHDAEERADLIALRKDEIGKAVNNLLRGVTAGLAGGGILGLLGAAAPAATGVGARGVGKAVVVGTAAGERRRGERQSLLGGRERSSYSGGHEPSSGPPSPRGSISSSSSEPDVEVGTSIPPASREPAGESPPPSEPTRQAGLLETTLMANLRGASESERPTLQIAYRKVINEHVLAALGDLDLHLKTFKSSLAQLEAYQSRLADLQGKVDELNTVYAAVDSFDPAQSALASAIDGTSSSERERLGGEMDEAERHDTELRTSDVQQDEAGESDPVQHCLQRKPGLFGRLAAKLSSTFLARRLRKLLSSGKKKLLAGVAKALGFSGPAKTAHDEVKRARAAVPGIIGGYRKTAAEVRTLGARAADAAEAGQELES